jgi:hypothetical protein
VFASDPDVRYVTRMLRVMAGLLLLVVSTARADDALTPGRVLDASNAAAADGLLPPEVLAHYKAGDYKSTIGAWPAGAPWEEGFEAASKANLGRLDVNDRGTIVDTASGAPATGIYGIPFRIEAADPKAGVKVMWNAYYALWRVGGTHDLLSIVWAGAKSKQREAVLESHLLFYEGVPPARRPKENALNLAQQTRAIVMAPADLNGTASLAWRFRDAEKQDQAWTYVPALRRVRQVSPTNRSDGFLGSDLSQDDGALFDGKPEDFTWKLVGQRDALVLADPLSLAGKVVRTKRDDGGWDDEWPADQKVVGYQDPAWTGLAWAPLGPVLVRRKVWIVEAKPRDPYYLFARIELAVDQETFQGVSSRKFDTQGALLRSLQFLTAAPQPIEIGGEKLVFPSTSMGYVLAENLKQERATIAGTVPPGKSVHSRRLVVEPGIFALEHLGAGK